MIVDDKQLRKILKALCSEAGSQRAWASMHSLDEATVSRVISGERDFSDGILKALKAKRVRKFELEE